MENEFCMITTTCGSHDLAKELASRLVEANLAACVQMMPVSSTYRWKGKVMMESEYLLMIKTLSRLYPLVEKAILENHPYETPEILNIPVHGGLTSYLGWIKETVN